MYIKTLQLTAAGADGAATASANFGTLDDSEVVAVAIHFVPRALDTVPNTTEVKITCLSPQGDAETIVDYTGNTNQPFRRIARPVFDPNLVAIAGMWDSPFVNGVVNAEVDTTDHGTVVHISVLLRELG